MITLEMFGLTDVGLHRSNNEDAFIVIPELHITAVADGMGGAAAGEVASRIFVTAVRECVVNSAASEEIAYQAVQQVFSCANQRMIEYVAGNLDAAGMGCTADLLIFAGARYIIGHVGDSRVYLFRNNELRQLTKDHSLVQMQLDGGVITAEEARVHPRKNIVLRAVGIEQDISLDILRGNSFSGDLFLLCSDGLSDMVEHNEIYTILKSPDPLALKTEQLVESAKRAGGRDNITVALCRVIQT